MAETAPIAPPAESAAPAKKQPKKKAAVSGGAKKSRPAKSGPSVSDLIFKAVSASKERSGVSLAALKKALAAEGYDVEKNNSRLKLALKALVSKERLVQLKGSGASGSFKVNKKQLQSQEKADKKKALPAAKAKSNKAAKPKSKAAKSPKKPKKLRLLKATPPPSTCRLMFSVLTFQQEKTPI
ncbi:histone H1A-like [Bombina bombina]|uniref:histone H1A-like n=1 Tax=Bombina bombina TaxID=8345 RepID=UPI00235A5757|nr:histone H1A-like [Bombina bombina]